MSSQANAPGQTFLQWWPASAPGGLSWRFAGAAVLGSAVLVVHARRWWRAARNGHFVRVPGWPWLGVALDLKDPETFEDNIEAWSREYGAGGVFEMTVAGERTIVVCDYEHVKPVLSARPFRMTRTSRLRQTLIPGQIPGLFFVEERQWSRQRRLTTSAFNAKALQSYMPDICHILGKLVRHLDGKVASGESVNISNLMRSFNTDVIMKLAFGDDDGSLHSEEPSPHLVSLDDLLVGLQTRITSLLPYWWIPGLSRFFDDADAAVRGLRAKAMEILHNPEAEGSAQFLSRLLEAEGDKLSKEEVIGNLVVFLIAGTDTSSHSLAWAFYHLARHPDVQRLVAAEAKDLPGAVEFHVEGHPGAAPDPEVVGNLMWAQAVWQETLRLNAVAPMLFVEAAEDLEMDGRTIPAGTPVWMMFKEACRRSAEYRAVIGEDWEEWRPSRWLSEDGSGRLRSCAPFDSIMFGHGARICPGRMLANTVGPLLLAQVLRRFEIDEWEGPPMAYRMNFVSCPAQDVKVRFSQRTA